MDLTRRSALSLAVLSTFSLAACGSSDDSADPKGGGTTSGPSAAGPVTFTLTGFGGTTVTLDGPPKVIVADSYSAASLAVYGIKPSAIFGWGIGDKSVTGDMDITGIPVVGRDSDLDLEKLTALKPDVIIGYGNGKDTGWTWWEKPVTERVKKIAPFVPIEFFGRAPDTIIAEYKNVATALGAEVDTPALRRADEDYAAAKKRLTTVTAATPRKVLAISADPQIVYTPGDLSQAVMLRGLGVQLVGPAYKKGEAWGEVSWENLPKYPADIVMPLEGGAYDSPVYKRLPAVAAEQTLEWNDKRPFTAQSYGAWLTQLADAIEKSKKLI